MKTQSGTVRIIAGKWRGRKLDFITSEVRPTGDRVRETLFNWLGSSIIGAKCLDPFAGSGALGFEALSRGAQSVTMLDKSPAVVKKLKENMLLLGAANVDIYLKKFPPLENDLKLSSFDIVFLDPPYNKNLIASSCRWLKENNCLKKGSLIYIEAEKDLLPLPIPRDWQVLKSKRAGQVGYHLIKCD